MYVSPMPYIIDTHVTEDYGEWGCAPRKPVIEFDFAHRGEWMDSVIGKDPRTNENRIYHVVRCENCIATHIFPLSSQTDLDVYYTNRFYQETKQDYLKNYEEDQEWWHAVHRTIFCAAEPFLPRMRGAMLDVGAGPGYPLDIAKDIGYCTHALEPSPIAGVFLHERGHIVIPKTLSSYVLHGNGSLKEAYDIIYLSEVLEHQPNPEAFLLDCYDLLAPGGVLVVIVPNDYSPGQLQAAEQYNIHPWWVAAPDHQFYFTPKTLQLLVRRCGFNIRFTRMTFPMVEHFMLEKKQCYVGHPALGRQCHHERVAYEMDMIQKGKWAELEADYVANVQERYGREIVMIAKKDQIA